MLKKILFLFCLALVGINSFSQSPSQKRSLLVKSIVQVTPPQITLSWTTYSTSTGYSIYRKLKSSTSWGNAISTPASSATQYIDNSPSLGVYYEYKVVRTSAVGTAIGYVSAGIEVPATDYRGKLILIVDNTMSTSLSSELTQLENDLIGDGWGVIRQDVSRTASPSSIKSIIQGIYNSDPSNVKAVYLFGHIPVYYSGDIKPDGHNPPIPYSVDSYYAEMTSTWTSSMISLPSDVELQVGRVDLYKMTAFALSETELLRAYLNKSHNFKSKQFTPLFRGLMSDNLQYISNPCAEGGYRTMGSLVGSSNLTTIPYNGSPQFWSVVTNEYLWTYCSGGGTYISANNIGSTQNFASTPHNGIFNMTFGSYFGNWDGTTAVPDWNNGTNNFLRSPLASGKALTNCYDAQPTWYFHHMGMGDNIGYGTLLSLNNRTANALYQPQNNGWDPQGYTTIHLSLMGDPSLRLQMVSPPSNLLISDVGGNFSFSWTASTDVILGYYLYEISPSGIISRIYPNIISGTSFNSSIPYVSGKKIMVRAVKMETSNTGTYYNLSLGSIATAPISAPPVVKLDIKVFLQGPLSGSMMNDNLRSFGYLPLSSPYSSYGYSHTNNSRVETIPSSILSVSGNEAIVDWVLVELRSLINVVSYSRTGLLRRDGKIVDMDGVSPLEFDISNGQYYVVVKHRNHLGIMSLNLVSLSNVPTSIDFTTGLTQLYGTDAQKVVNGVNCLWAGDVTFNGVIKYAGSGNDRDPIMAIVGFVPTNIVNGYYKEDVNMDGGCKYTGSANDPDIILVNIGGTIPTNVKNQQIP